MKRLVIAGLVTVVALLLGATVGTFPHPLHLSLVETAPLFLCLGMLRPLKLIPKAKDSLWQQAKPGSVDMPEAVPWYFFHRGTYAAAGQVLLNFFHQTEADPGLSNMQQAGQFPTPQFFEVFSIHFGVNGANTNAVDAATPTGAVADEEIIRRSGRGRFLLTLTGKEYGEWPLHAIGPVGNPYGIVQGIDNVAAGGTPSIYQISGWLARFEALDPIVTIPPTESFRVRCLWNAVAAISAATVVETGLYGVYQRKVV